MMGYTLILVKFDQKECDHATYEKDNNKGKVLGEGVVENTSTITICSALLVKGLKKTIKR